MKRKRKQKSNKIRVHIEWNTGTRIEIPIRGPGSYKRKPKHPKIHEMYED